MSTLPTGITDAELLHSTLRKRIPELLLEHEELERRFEAHQEALFNRDVSGAIAHLAHYKGLLEAHLGEEEERWLPLYETFGLAPRGGSAELLHAEHQKILQRLQVLEAATQELSELPELRALDLIAAFDREGSFKHLLEHHDLRERRYFFPALEAWCAGKEPHAEQQD